MRITLDIDNEQLDKLLSEYCAECIEIESRCGDCYYTKLGYLLVISGHTVREDYEKITKPLVEKGYITQEEVDRAWKGSVD